MIFGDLWGVNPMSSMQSSTPYPRTQLFTLQDGTAVIQWGDHNVQDIATGNYSAYTSHDFGRWLSDEELARLKEQHIIQHYNRTYIWLYALPEHGRFRELRTQETSNLPRHFYLNTTLTPEYLGDVTQYLIDSGLASVGAEAHVRDEVIAITGERAALFLDLDEAESALSALLANAPDWMTATTIAFANAITFEAVQAADAFSSIDLDALIAAQDAHRFEGNFDGEN